MNTIRTSNQISPHNDVNSELEDDDFVWLVQYKYNIKLELKGPTLARVVTILAELIIWERERIYTYIFLYLYIVFKELFARGIKFNLGLSRFEIWRN